MIFVPLALHDLEHVPDGSLDVLSFRHLRAAALARSGTRDTAGTSHSPFNRGPEHYNTNFADALPIFDILFGTYRRPTKDEFRATGVGPEFPPPRTLRSAQFGPLWAVLNILPRRRSTF